MGIEIFNHAFSEDHSQEAWVNASPHKGNGGAPFEYLLGLGDAASSEVGQPYLLDLRFQQGNPNEVGGNGILEIQLLHVIKHRAEAFLAGPLASPETQEFLNLINQAIESMNKRHKRRKEAGVAYTQKPDPNLSK